MKINKRTRKKNCLTKKLVNITSMDRHRLHIKRSLKNISAQIIDDINNRTLVAASSVEKSIKNVNKIKKSELSLIVGEILAKRAIKKSINKIYFDRGCYKYHGRIKILTEALRKHGLEF